MEERFPLEKPHGSGDGAESLSPFGSSAPKRRVHSPSSSNKPVPRSPRKRLRFSGTAPKPPSFITAHPLVSVEEAALLPALVSAPCGQFAEFERATDRLFTSTHGVSRTRVQPSACGDGGSQASLSPLGAAGDGPQHTPSSQPGGSATPYAYESIASSQEDPSGSMEPSEASRVNKSEAGGASLRLTTRYVAFAYFLVRDVVRKLKARYDIVDEALDVFFSCMKGHNMRNRSIEGIAAASVFLALRRCSAARSLADVAGASSVSVKELNRHIKLVDDTLTHESLMHATTGAAVATAGGGGGGGADGGVGDAGLDVSLAGDGSGGDALPTSAMSMEATIRVILLEACGALGTREATGHLAAKLALALPQHVHARCGEAHGIRGTLTARVVAAVGVWLAGLLEEDLLDAKDVCHALSVPPSQLTPVMHRVAAPDLLALLPSSYTPVLALGQILPAIRYHFPT